MLAHVAGPVLLVGLGLLQAPAPAPTREVPTPPLVQATGLFANSATNPYERVFIVPAQRHGERGSVARVPARDTKPVMRCGMKVIVADPSIDPRIVAKVTANPDPKMVIPMPPCPEDKR